MTEKVMEQEPQSFNKNAFIAEVQRYDCLYNKSGKYFKDKYMKFNCWTKIGQKFGMEAAHAETKFTNLHSAYTWFLRKVKNLPRIRICGIGVVASTHRHPSNYSKSSETEGEFFFEYFTCDDTFP
jgi:hypothetical protein